LALLHDLALPPDVGAGFDLCQESHLLAGAFGLFDGHHPVGACRHRCPGHDPSSLTRRELETGWITGGDGAGDGQAFAGGDIAAEGKAVHRRDIGGGDIQRGDLRLYQDSAKGLLAVDLFAAERLDLRGYSLPGFSGWYHLAFSFCGGLVLGLSWLSAALRCHSGRKYRDAILTRLEIRPRQARIQDLPAVTAKFKYRGNLAETPLPEMLYTIDRFRIPGIVEAKHKDVIKRVFVRDGYIVHASSSDRGDSLGDYLEKLGTLEPKQLAKVKKARDSASKRFGVLCIEKGILSPVEVFEFVRAQIEGIVWSLFYWGEGEVTFGIGALTDEDMVQI
jgi:hypothetical protein